MTTANQTATISLQAGEGQTAFPAFRSLKTWNCRNPTERLRNWTVAGALTSSIGHRTSYLNGAKSFRLPDRPRPPQTDPGKYFAFIAAGTPGGRVRTPPQANFLVFKDQPDQRYLTTLFSKIEGTWGYPRLSSLFAITATKIFVLQQLS